jgi:hypothetical protein
LLITVLLTGLAVITLLKYINASSNPFWCAVDATSGGYNKAGLGLGTLALVEYVTRPLELFPAAPLPDEKEHATQTPPTCFQEFILALGLGSLIHLLHTFATDGGTIIAWTWSGYPITGPTLHPFGGCAIAAIALATNFRRVLRSSWSIFGAATAITLYRFQDWYGFLGGLGLITFVISLVPQYLRAASAGSPAFTFGFALLVYCLLGVASVVTTAYAFVPFGNLLRERTDLVLGFSVACVILGNLVSSGIVPPEQVRLKLRARIRIEWIERWTLVSSLLVAALACAVSYDKMPTKAPEPFSAHGRVFTGGIWTVRRAGDMLMTGSFRG